MDVLAFVSGNDDRRVIGGTFNTLLNAATGGGATVITSRIRAVFNGFLTVFPPSIAVVEMIHFAFSHERKSRLSYPFLILFFRF